MTSRNQHLCPEMHAMAKIARQLAIQMIWISPFLSFLLNTPCHSPNVCHFRQCVHFWTYLDTRVLSRSKRENPGKEVVRTTYGDGYHIFPPKWRWFTPAHYLVLRKSPACSRPLLRGLFLGARHKGLEGLEASNDLIRYLNGLSVAKL